MIGGPVLGASALPSSRVGGPAAFAWLRAARMLGIALYLPMLALAEVRVVHPDAAPLLAEQLNLAARPGSQSDDYRG